MAEASVRTELRRARRALGALDAASDRAVTLLTIPVDPVERRWLVGSCARPAVEPELWSLHVRYARDRDPDALERLVDRYRPHAEAHARRHFRHGEPIDDLTQVAYEALVQALSRFDPGRRIPFLAFAKPTIIGGTTRPRYAHGTAPLSSRNGPAHTVNRTNARAHARHALIREGRTA